jgi:hypothetical protein
VLDADEFTTASMRRLMRWRNRCRLAPKLDLEINPRHPVIVGLTGSVTRGPRRQGRRTDLRSCAPAAGVVDDP